ncbi:MAG TPA: methionine biosynthesis protein MetW [Nitrospirota bacterium]|jgi:methionine biosynthesis protein MetW
MKDKLSGYNIENIDPSLLSLPVEGFKELLNRMDMAPKAGPPRWQDDIIEREMPVGVSVLDLGCNEGELLERLSAHGKRRAQGVELDPEAVLKCIGKGVPVIQADLDQGLSGFQDSNFDYVVLEETLQTLKRPVEILKEMLRVGRRGIVSFPNFGYWRVRMDFALRGRMPVTKGLPYTWYDTPNIHLFTLADFFEWAEQAGVKIVRAYVLSEGEVRELRDNDNMFAEEALLVVEKIRR